MDKLELEALLIDCFEMMVRRLDISVTRQQDLNYNIRQRILQATRE